MITTKNAAGRFPLTKIHLREGYLVEYEDGYKSWSPKDVFESAYQENGKLDFGHAIFHLKRGKAVSRAGWNGKGMCIYLNKGSRDISQEDLDKKENVEGISFELFERSHTGATTRLPNLNMKAATGSTVTGWLASQTDILAEDWGIVE